MSERDPGGAHLSDERLLSLVRASEGSADAEHVATCSRCSRELEVLRLLQGADAAEPSSSPCPDELALVELADGRCSEPDRQELEAHLRGCSACALAFDVIGDDDLRRSPSPRHAWLTKLSETLRDFLAPEMPPCLAFSSRGARQRPEPLLEEALATYRDGRFAEARVQLEEALAAGSEDPGAHFFLGACLLESGDAEEAQARFAAAAKARPKLGEYRWHLARALLTLGRPQEAARELSRCARMPGPHRGRARELAAELERLAANAD